MPTSDEIRAKLIEVISAILLESGEAEPALTAKSRPLKDAKGFDSPLGVVVTGVVASELGIDIPLDLNIFVDDKKKALTIDESTALVYGLLKNGSGK
jgi:hypothetical protein